jgi:hypothetical protein
MAEHRSFRISDFSLRDVPRSVAAYLVISLFAIGFGVFFGSLPRFWSGVLLGAGCALPASLLLLRLVRKEVDVAALPSPSATVRAKWDDPNCSPAEAVKACRDETGLGFAEATAVVRNYQAGEPPRARPKCQPKNPSP